MNEPKLKISNGRVIDPAKGIDRTNDVWIANGQIVAIGSQPADFSIDLEIDASEQIVCPGIIDICARLREPGLEHKATIASECLAASSAGITTLVTPPDTDPVIDTPAVVELIHQRAARTGLTKIEVVGALTHALDGQTLAEMGALGLAGCVGVSNATVPIESTEVMRRAMEYAATFGLTVFCQPNDPWLSRDAHVHHGAVSTRLGLSGLPETAETITLSRDLLLAEQTGARLHVLHVSTRRGAEMIAQAKAAGLPVSASVTAHHLRLSEAQSLDFNSDCHVVPPLRTDDDRAGLREHLANGTLDIICSDHQPHDKDAKQNPFPATEPGISALETLLPISLQTARELDVDIGKIIACLTHAPAILLGLPRGTLTLGSVADLCIFDPNKRWQLSESNMLSRGHNTPFLGHTLCGQTTHTVMNGKLVYKAEH